ncbi:hypothetical protein [Bombiscardovia coagulans]|uniref:Uncharacterized protein n=1 Tax=Bombiscardovia coagulans TaxID=686666 RepID=A0A261EW39_9BIFI|nr:hypothetical protein [Bombiscardovia coagulans]OZG50876.1 hypothetical protein BOCO_0062 [Bombiscardovia coagulans]
MRSVPDLQRFTPEDSPQSIDSSVSRVTSSKSNWISLENRY